jgi:hypothetical protein
MFNILSHQRNVNKNYCNSASPSYNDYHRKKIATNTGEDVREVGTLNPLLERM